MSERGLRFSIEPLASCPAGNGLEGLLEDEGVMGGEVDGDELLGGMVTDPLKSLFDLPLSRKRWVKFSCT